jgi:hypothetical protein
MKGQLNLQKMQARGPTLIGVLPSIYLEERGVKRAIICSVMEDSKGFRTL